MCVGLLSRNTWKSDLVIGLASFDYAVLFCLPKSQSLEWFKQLFKSFGDRGSVNKDMQSSSKDCYVEFVDDLWYVYFDDSGKGPDFEDMITFLSRYPEQE